MLRPLSLSLPELRFQHSYKNAGKACRDTVRFRILEFQGVRSPLPSWLIGSEQSSQLGNRDLWKQNKTQRNGSLPTEFTHHHQTAQRTNPSPFAPSSGRGAHLSESQGSSQEATSIVSRELVYICHTLYASLQPDPILIFASFRSSEFDLCSLPCTSAPASLPALLSAFSAIFLLRARQSSDASLA